MGTIKNAAVSGCVGQVKREGRLRSVLDDTDAAVGLVVFHDAVLQREEGPVTTDADILASVGLGAALADDDAAGANDFAAEKFDPEPL